MYKKINILPEEAIYIGDALSDQQASMMLVLILGMLNGEVSLVIFLIVIMYLNIL